jgi:hypothetical protein
MTIPRIQRLDFKAGVVLVGILSRQPIRYSALRCQAPFASLHRHCTT